jgi:hypothetical protein
MKKSLCLIIILLTASNLYPQDDEMNSVTKIIGMVKESFAPDKRVALFQISAEDKSGLITLTGETNLFVAKEKLISELISLGVEFRDEIELLPAEELGENIYGIVNLSVSNIRSKTEHSAELTTQALLGTPVKIYKKKSGFYLIQTPDNYISWVDDDGIVQVNKSKLKEWIGAEKVIFTKEYGFSFSEPDESSPRVSDLTAGNILVLLGEQNNFNKVKYPDGRIAFINKIFCTNYSEWLNKPALTNEDILNTAKLIMGVPYLWGGTSAKGVDCSGFTKTVYFLNGIVLARDASQQAEQGELIDTGNGFDKLTAGDLLFFGAPATDSTKERITHVGIYLGDYKYIHAAGMVKINSFDRNADNFNEYRLKHFRKARRILTSIDNKGITSVKKNKFYLGEI